MEDWCVFIPNNNSNYCHCIVDTFFSNPYYFYDYSQILLRELKEKKTAGVKFRLPIALKTKSHQFYSNRGCSCYLLLES